MIPALPALAAFVASIVGYQIPVVCTPVQGATISYSIDGTPYTFTNPTSNVEGQDGLTLFVGVRPGATTTIGVAGQAVTLPPAPADTPETHEGTYAPGYVAIPVFIALSPTFCANWTPGDPSAFGSTLLLATHEAMHARFADGNEGLTECRAMKAVPGEITTLWPASASLRDPGAEPDKPSAPHRTRAWRQRHPVLWRRLEAHYRHALAAWRVHDAAWHRAEAAWNTYTQILDGVRGLDASMPAQYHGVNC